jgi:hypothetical protein
MRTDPGRPVPAIIATSICWPTTKTATASSTGSPSSPPGGSTTPGHPGAVIDNVFKQAVRGFDILRAGVAGLLSLGPAADPRPDELLFGQARTWISSTPYQPTRDPHIAADFADAIKRDL